jgi:hypothetical protein
VRKASAGTGNSGVHREYLEFVVGGTSLRQLLKHVDLLGGVGLWTPEGEQAQLQQLLCSRPGNSPSGRVPILVCNDCGDLGCGAVTMRVAETETEVVWSDFAFENSYDAEITTLYPAIGPFEFDKADYWKTLSKHE